MPLIPDYWPDYLKAELEALRPKKEDYPGYEIEGAMLAYISLIEVVDTAYITKTLEILETELQSV